MSTTEEVAAPAVEQPATEAPAAVEPKQKAEKPVKEKKPKAPKEKKPKLPKTAAHPPYFQMIKEALLALDEKSGSSPYAIAKYMEEKHKQELPSNYKKILGLQLKNSAARGKLIKIKASYKLSEAGKKVTVAKPANAEKKAKPKQTTKAKPKQTTKVAPKAKAASAAAKKPEAAAKKPETAVKKAPKRKASTKNVGPGPKKPKKSTPSKPKQPKSIKSPAAKRARKAAAK